MRLKISIRILNRPSGDLVESVVTCHTALIQAQNFVKQKQFRLAAPLHPRQINNKVINSLYYTTNVCSIGNNTGRYIY